MAARPKRAEQRKPFPWFHPVHNCPSGAAPGFPERSLETLKTKARRAARLTFSEYTKELSTKDGDEDTAVL